MDLREYGRILLRRWWLILALPLLAGIFTVATYRAPVPRYNYDLQFSVSFLPIERERSDQDPRLGAVQASEYVADDLTEVFVSSRFATMVQSHLPNETPIGAIIAATRAEREHRLITLTLEGRTAEEVQTLGTAVRTAAREDLASLLGELWGAGDLRLEVMNEAGPYLVEDGLRSQLDVPIRVVIALVAAVVLAFALDYLDDSIRNRAEAEQLVGRVLGEIPGR